MKIRNNLIALTLLGFGLTLGQTLSAATCASWAGGDTVNFTTSTDCITTTGGPGGNENIGQMNTLPRAFGATEDWKSIEKIELPATTGTYFSITFNRDKKSGTWVLDAGYKFDPTKMYAFAIKGGNGNGENGIANIVYLMDTNFRGGTWKTSGLLNQNNQPGLSHIVLLGTGNLTAVPLPAAAYLFGSALLGMAGIGYRRKNKAS